MPEEQIEVSVKVATYFHEKYIAQALDSILMQETSFKFEVLVGDDASRDGTPEIIKDYAERYPDIIRAVLRPENLGATRNAQDLEKLARGRYFAVLEGDDYWTDPHKLQKQWEFLESNPEYSGCCGKCVIVDQDGEPNLEAAPRFFNCRKVLTLEQFLDTWTLPSQVGTWMYRNYTSDMTPGERRVRTEANRDVGDKTAMLLLLTRGPFYCSNEAFSCYRYVRKGGTNYFSRHYADPYRNYRMFLYPCYLEGWIKKEYGIKHYSGKNKEYRFCRFVEETVREPSARRIKCLAEMIAESHQPIRYMGLLGKALIEMED